jgi:hypothetical protein
MSLTKITYSMIEGAPVNMMDYVAVGEGMTRFVLLDRTH